MKFLNKEKKKKNNKKENYTSQNPRKKNTQYLFCVYINVVSIVRIHTESISVKK